jgi:chaperonin GroES
MKKFRPFKGRVVIKRDELATETEWGIILPDNRKETPQTGTVVAVGPAGYDEDGKLIEVEIKEGDKVMFAVWSGSGVKIDGEEYLVMRQSDLLGIVD